MTARTSPTRGGGRGERRSGRDVLTRLTPHEAAAVLRELCDRHPELAREAREIARTLAADVSTEAIAEEVERAVLGLGYDALRSRAGRHEWGYVDPGDAAWELLQEEIGGHIENVRRLRELGLAASAEAVCRGVVLGLYAVRDSRAGDVLQWAQGFPAEGAGAALEALLAATPAKERAEAQRRIRSFLEDHTPGWAGLSLDTRG